MKTISAIAEIDEEGWLTVHTRMSEKMAAGTVEAVIVLQSVPESAEVHDSVMLRNQQKRMECIRGLRKLGKIAGMEDPCVWQRSIREDRTLPLGG